MQLQTLRGPIVDTIFIEIESPKQGPKTLLRLGRPSWFSNELRENRNLRDSDLMEFLDQHLVASRKTQLELDATRSRREVRHANEIEEDPSIVGAAGKSASSQSPHRLKLALPSCTSYTEAFQRAIARSRLRERATAHRAVGGGYPPLNRRNCLPP